MATPRDLAHLLLARAGEDEAAAEAMMPIATVTNAIVAFHAQQAVEKALKAVLAAREHEFPFTHDLDALAELCRSKGIVVPTELGDLDRPPP